MLFILKIIFGFIVQVNKPKFSPMYFDGMIYIKLYARFVTPPPSFTSSSKRPLRQYWFISLKCYSDWQLGTIQIELTTLTLRITEDSAKQLVDLVVQSL